MSALLKHPIPRSKIRPTVAAKARELEAASSELAGLSRRISALQDAVDLPKKLVTARKRQSDFAAIAAAAGRTPPSISDASTFETELRQAEEQAGLVETEHAGKLAAMNHRRIILQQQVQPLAKALNSAIAEELVREAEPIAAKYARAFREMADALEELLGLTAAVDQLTDATLKIGPFGNIDFIRAPGFRLTALPDGAVTRRIDVEVIRRSKARWMAETASWAENEGVK